MDRESIESIQTKMAVFVHRLSRGGANTVLLNVVSFFKDSMDTTLVSAKDGPVGNLYRKLLDFLVKYKKKLIPPEVKKGTSHVFYMATPSHATESVHEEEVMR